nr:DNA repair protein RecN [Burkholderiales bacterium]
MLLTLDIADFVLVDRLSLEVPHGFSTFTGETGAGKSILVDALALLLGGRADAGIVREGAARAEVAGTFDAAGLTALQAWCDAQGCPVDDGVVVLRRVVDAQGRSRAWINGRTATVAQLREAGEHLVEIHGQHEHQALVRPAGQRAILDAHAGAAVAAADVETAWQAWRDAHAARVAAESDATRFAEERERLRWQRDELEPLALAPEAWADLQADHARLAHAAALIDGVEAAVDALTEADDAVVARLARVRDGLDSLVAHESALGDVVAALDAAQIQCDEGARALRHVRARLEIDPERLAEVDARLQAVVAGARRFRVAPEALQAHVADLDARIAALEAASDPQQLARSEADALARWQHAAAALTALRTHAARTLEAAVTDAMQTLAMGGGAFAVRLEPVDAPSAQGAEAVVFAVRGH